MSRLWRSLGLLAGWLTWPVLIWFLRGSRRTRVLVRAGDRILVIQNWLSSEPWDLPGGGAHRGEDAAVAAQRELREETGLVLPVESFTFLQRAERRYRWAKFTYDLFEVVLPEPLPVRGRWPELTKAAWVPVNELRKQRHENALGLALELWRN